MEIKLFLETDYKIHGDSENVKRKVKFVLHHFGLDM